MEFSCKLFVLVLLLPTIARCGADSISQECSKNFSSDSNTMLQLDNINHAFFGLLAKTPLYGYATASYGVGMDAIYGLTKCRGDISLETCSACILDAADKIRTICPFSAEARIWYEYCFLRYDSNNFLGQPDTSNIQKWHSPAIAKDPMAFDQAVGKLLGVVKVAAVTRNDKFGRYEINDLKNNVTIYGMAQCTRDLQASACNQCLEKLSEDISGNCKDLLGCYRITSSCVLRYEINNFLIGVEAQSPNANAPAPF